MRHTREEHEGEAGVVSRVSDSSEHELKHFIWRKVTNDVIVVIANINWGISTDKVNFLKCLSFNGTWGKAQDTKKGKKANFIFMLKNKKL